MGRDHPDYDEEGRAGSRFDNTTEGLDKWYQAEMGGQGGTSWHNLCTTCEPGSTTGVGGAAVRRGEPRPYRNLQPMSTNVGEPMGALGGNAQLVPDFGAHERLGDIGPDQEPDGGNPQQVTWAEHECEECGTAITGTPPGGRGEHRDTPYPKRLDQDWPIQQDARLASQQWARGN